MATTLSIDFGSRYVGFALVEHPSPRVNRVLYAGTLVIDAKPLNALVETRSAVRRLRRTRKTHKRRLRRLAQALVGIPNAEAILRFCSRRGFSHQEDERDEQSFHLPRQAFFEALRAEIAALIPAEHAERVASLCSRHLNEACRRDAELRPARFENRGPSKCNWHGCRHNVPRASNDISGRLRQSLFVWLAPIFAQSAEPAKLRRSIDHWIGELDGLAVGRMRRKKAEDDCTSIDQRVKKVLGMIAERAVREAPGEVGLAFRENWTKYYRKNIREILGGGQGGRVRFCREHSVAYVDHILAGKVPPYRQELTEADLISRKQQIVFGRLWRLVESRMLPLAQGKIDRVIVERVALDLLACSFKDKQKIPQEKAAEMYWQGPQFGHESRMEMLKAEFGGRCAYCGAIGTLQQVEHLLPRSAFPFDSYFNVLPACVSCNHRKGARTALEAGLRVHDEAYAAFGEYVKTRKPPHAYHHIKKGLLNLLRREATSEDAERRLGMLANDLVTATTTQRSPRPLARYVATKLERATGARPEIAYCSGRHTALYRQAALPDYEKAQLRAEGDLRNHAVDAIILGCDFPSAAALENKQWRMGSRDLLAWSGAVRAAAPEIVAEIGLPKVENDRLLKFFEVDEGAGYCRIDLAAFNWNRERKGTHQLDPFGVTATGLPLKRVPAASVLEGLKKSAEREKQIKAIAHRALRALLEKDPDHAAEQFVRWLQGSVLAGLATGTMGKHPADLARKGQLERFTRTSVSDIIEVKEPIPAVIGVRCLNKGSENKLEVRRVDSAGREFQRYQAQPVHREWHVGYRVKDGAIDRRKPIIFTVSQSFQLKDKNGKTPETIPPESPLRGRAHGTRTPRREFMIRWKDALRLFLESEGLIEVFKLAQGCVIEKHDGTRFQFRNFDKGGDWMKAGSLQNIRCVHRSPLKGATN